MKSALVTMMFVLTPLLAAPGGDVAPVTNIEWGLDLGAALARSAADNRPVMAYFSYEGCPWCRRTDRDVLTDPRVVSAASRFVWVRVDRDAHPSDHDRFGVKEYPTFLTLNAAGQNVYRVKGFRDANAFVAVLSTAADRYRRLAAGEKVPDVEASDDMIAELPGIRSLPTPLPDVPTGICVLGDDLWIVQNKILQQIDKHSGELKFSVPTQATVSDITTDGQRIFLASFGWSNGDPIMVFHPQSGRFVRQIVADKYRNDRHGYRTHGIAFHDGVLWVLAMAQLHKVDPATGDIISWKSVDPQYRSLDFVGDQLVTGSPDGVVFLDKTQLTISRRIPTRHHVRNLAADATDLFLVGQPQYDFDRDHNRVLAWPPEMTVFRAPHDPATNSTVVE